MTQTEKSITTPDNILKISRQFVTEYFKTVSQEDQEWIKECIKQHTEKSGQVKYFAGFRSDFAKKFFPELVGAKKAKVTVSLLDELNAIDSAAKDE